MKVAQKGPGGLKNAPFALRTVQDSGETKCQSRKPEKRKHEKSGEAIEDGGMMGHWRTRIKKCRGAGEGRGESQRALNRSEPR